MIISVQREKDTCELKANCTDLWLSVAHSVLRLTRVSRNKNVERIVTYTPVTGQRPRNNQYKPAVTK
jgi:hypothetical protein